MKKRGFILVLVSLSGFVFFTHCKKTDKDSKELDCSSISSAYNSDIKPIIAGNCLSAGCHNTNSPNGDFTKFSEVKAKVDNGSFERRVVKQKNMPPSGALSTDNINKITCWLNSGAPDN